MRSRRSRPVIRASLMSLAGAIACAACSAGSPAASVQKKVQGLMGQPNITSFLDVRFGDSLYRVQNRFPSGTIETAPYGSDTYRIDHIEVDGIRYQRIKYEFTTYSGMQLVMAWFTPESSGQVLEKLIAAVGPPTEQINTKGSSAPADAQASWHLPHGELVVYDGPKRFVAVVGPGGGPLKQDAAENESLDSP
jgi:hypothetical protein